jgi:hypothetical protein
MAGREEDLEHLSFKCCGGDCETSKSHAMQDAHNANALLQFLHSNVIIHPLNGLSRRKPNECDIV